ncbi:hypothetical protein C357_12619 [Citreicella sp. 357]|nr:hypothetical protein C357_12619 [Citreicella sp. 357]
MDEIRPIGPMPCPPHQIHSARAESTDGARDHKTTSA